MGTSATDVERLIQAARLHLAHGELHEAAGRATEAIRLDGKQAAAYLLRAEAHRRLKRPERALADLAVAIRLDPQQSGPYVIRAEILKRRCLLDQAIADATSALMVDPRNAAAYAIRAQCRYAIGDQDGAREDVQEMLLIDPTRPVPDLRAGAVSDSSPTTATDDERFWKQAGGREDERALFADGKPVDRTYRSRPAVSDEDAPEVLGAASGYKPGVVARPIPRMSGRAKRSLGHGGGGAIVMLGVAMVAGCALWMGFRGATGPEPSTRSAPPQPSSVVESNAPQPIPASARPGAAESTGRRASTPAKPLDLKPVVRDLGSFSLTPDGRTWVVVMPERFTRAELAFYRGTPDDLTLNAAWAAHLQINGRDVVRFTDAGNDEGTFFFHFHDYTSDTDYREEGGYQKKPLRRYIDVTKFLKPGDNMFQYYHEQRPDLPMGVVLAITPAADTDVPRSEVGAGQATGIVAQTPEVSSPVEVDLLRYADPRWAITGAWSRRGRMLNVSPNRNQPAVLPIPYAVPGEYDLEVRADSGKAGLLMIGLAHGEARFTACLSMTDGKYWLQEFAGQPMQDNESTRRGPVFRDGEGITVRCNVRDDGVVISCRGQRLIDWKGDYSRFTARPLAMVEIPEKRSLFLASWVGCRFTACRLTPVSTGERVRRSGTRAVTPGTPEGSGHQSDRTPGEIRRLEGHTGVILGVAFSPDGKWVASSGDTTVRLWKVGDLSDDAHIVLATQEPQPKGFIAVAFSPDGKLLAASRFDGSIALWDMTASPPKRIRVLHGHDDPVVALTFSPDGQTLVTGGRNDGLVRFWDMANPAATPRTTIPPEKNGVWSLAYSPDGKTLAEGVSFPRPGKPFESARPGEIWLWDVSRRPHVKRAVVKEARKVPRSLAFSPDGSRLAFGDGDLATVIDAGTGRRLGTFEGHTSFVVTVAFTPDGKRAISGGYDKAVRLWDATTMEQVHVFDGHEGYVEQVAVSPDGRLVASCGHDRTVRLWRLPDRAGQRAETTGEAAHGPQRSRDMQASPEPNSRAATDLPAATEVVALAELNTPGHENGLWLSPDGLVIYGVTVARGADEGEIWSARRRDPGSLFTDKRPLGRGRHVAVSADGLTMYLVQRRASGTPPGDAIHVATRRSTEEPFGRPQEVAELRSVPAPRNLFLSTDGLSLYFNHTPGSVVGVSSATRASTRSKWGRPLPVAVTWPDGIEKNLLCPFVTADGLKLYGVVGERAGDPRPRFAIWSRKAANQPFSNPAFLTLLGVEEFSGWYPRPVEATRELFFSSQRLSTGGGLDLWLVRNFKP